jgi:hypothetical protein
MILLKTGAFWDIMPHQLLSAVVTDISEEHIAAIFGIKKSKKWGLNCLTLKVAV